MNPVSLRPMSISSSNVEDTWYGNYSDWPRDRQPGGRILSPRRVNNVHFRISSGQHLRSTQPDIQCDSVARSQGIKRLEREAAHSQLVTSSQCVATHLPPPYVFTAPCSVKNRDNHPCSLLRQLQVCFQQTCGQPWP
jgi:hypothetical protein